MATITMNIPNAVLTRVVDGLCDGVDSSNSKAKQVVIDFVKGKVISYESGSVAQTAINGVIADVKTNIDIT